MNQVTRESNDGRESVALFLHYVKINCHEHSITSNEVWKKKIKNGVSKFSQLKVMRYSLINELFRLNYLNVVCLKK